MIDSSKAPVPAWKRYLTMIVMVALVLVAGYLFYSKELHHSSGSGAASSPAVTNPAPSTSVATTSTTIPGGVAPSNRDPFSG
jgi:hypothetical protein